VADLNLDAVPITHNQAANRFEAHVSGQSAFITYRRLNGTIIFDHTEVPAALEGHGLAGKLVQAALEYARSANLKVLPLCAYVAGYIRKHPEYQSLLSPATLKRLFES
jgi:predicted GNAT family acetyltransferase